MTTTSNELKPTRFLPLLLIFSLCAWGDCFNQAIDITQTQPQPLVTGGEEGDTEPSAGVPTPFDCIISATGSDCVLRGDGGPWNIRVTCDGVAQPLKRLSSGAVIDPIENATESHSCDIAIEVGGETVESVTRDFTS